MRKYRCLLLILPFCWSCMNKQSNSGTGYPSALDSASFKKYWTIEAVDTLNNIVRHFGDTLEIKAPGGFTLWRNEKFSGDTEISYKACVMDEGLKGDRLSDLNCFWMASDPLHPDDIFERGEWRNGVFERYYSLQMYYLGYGGNDNTTTRFRRYNGDHTAFEKENVKPAVITEFTDKEHLLQPNHWYDIKIVCTKGNVKYFIDDKLLINFDDKAPYTSGWFGFRTTQARVRLTQFKVN